MNRTLTKKVRKCLLACMFAMLVIFVGTKSSVTEVSAATYYTVSFRSPTGATSSAFNKLKVRVKSGTKVKMPSVPAKTGYTALGWSTRKNASSAAYTVGKSYTIRKNITFYAVRKYVGTAKVYFNNNKGTSSSSVYTRINKKVTKNTYITLPTVPTASGYTNLGWTTSKGKSTPLYKVGTKVKITKTTRFYAVRRKNVSVNFYLENGSQTSAYKKLKETVAAGTYVTMPSVPAANGYVTYGWTNTKNGTTVKYYAGKKYKISSNTKLYAVRKKAVTVTLCKNNGTEWQTKTVGYGTYLQLPGARNASGHTMMGWSTSPYKTTIDSSDYEVGEQILVTKAVPLYAVVFNRSAEPDLTADQLAQPDIQRYYEKVIFVGDSRTCRMADTVKNMLPAYLKERVCFVAEEGQGVYWFEETGFDELMAEVEKTGTLGRKKIAVIFNLGINDLQNIDEYVAYMDFISSDLTAKGCKLFYMSLNPTNNAILKAYGRAERPEARVRSFNETIKSDLCYGGSYTYIDTYNYLMQNGYGTDSGKYGVDSGTDDGLHYTLKTYKRIYDYCIRAINS